MLIQRVLVFLIRFLAWFNERIRYKKLFLVIIIFSVYSTIRLYKKRTRKSHQQNKANENPLISEYEDHVETGKATPIRSLWTDETFECIGWKQLYKCKKKKENEKDEEIEEEEEEEEDDETEEEKKRATKNGFKKCDEYIEHEMAGYCIVRNRTSGEFFEVMVSSCWSMREGYRFTCELARDFSEYAIHSIGYEHEPIASSFLGTTSKKVTPQANNGILFIVYEKVLPSTYSTIKMLRHHGCELPIEIWYRPDEMSIDNPILHELLLNFHVRVRPIFDHRAHGFHVKPYALYYSDFDNVLLLDADNIPAKDPTYLFDDPEFLRTGAIFWPDYWQPSNSLFQLTKHSLVWELLGMKYVDMFEQESGQVLISRRKNKKALDQLMFLSTHMPRLLDELGLVWGDKDLFRLAWLNTSTPFHYINNPPAIGGIIMEKHNNIFCGLAMIQHDVQGNLIFFHRNSIKLDGKPNQPKIMTHIQEYSLEKDPKDYHIRQLCGAYRECCYYIGTKTTSHREEENGRHLHPSSQILPITETTHAKLEELAIEFSIEGRNLLEIADEARKEPMGFLEMMIMGLLLYVFIIICLVWLRAKSSRERLPSRWKPMDEKQN